MSAATAKYGILVGVDGSAQSNAAVAWAAREAVMRQLPITLLHIVAPVVVGWPVGQLYANMTEWQKDNAQQVIEQAREARGSVTVISRRARLDGGRRCPGVEGSPGDLQPCPHSTRQIAATSNRARCSATNSQLSVASFPRKKVRTKPGRLHYVKVTSTSNWPADHDTRNRGRN